MTMTINIQGTFSWSKYTNYHIRSGYGGKDLENRFFFMSLENINFLVCRCLNCGVVKEEYTDEELGLFIIILEMFIHREPVLAAPILPQILNIVSKYVTTNLNLNCSINDFKVIGNLLIKYIRNHSYFLLNFIDLILAF